MNTREDILFTTIAIAVGAGIAWYGLAQDWEVIDAIGIGCVGVFVTLVLGAFVYKKWREEKDDAARSTHK